MIRRKGAGHERPVRPTDRQECQRDIDDVDSNEEHAAASLAVSCFVVLADNYASRAMQLIPEQLR